MNGMGTDVLALACIFGGAAVGGGVTMAALNQLDAPGCSAETLSVHTVVVGAHAHGGVFTATPNVRVRGAPGCGIVVVHAGDVRVRFDEARVRARVEEALARAEEARSRADEVRQRVEEEVTRLDAGRSH